MQKASLDMQIGTPSLHCQSSVQRHVQASRSDSRKPNEISSRQQRPASRKPPDFQTQRPVGQRSETNVPRDGFVRQFGIRHFEHNWCLGTSIKVCILTRSCEGGTRNGVERSSHSGIFLFIPPPPPSPLPPHFHQVRSVTGKP